MKRIKIISDCFVPGGEEGPLHLFTGSVVDLDDDVAGNLVAAARATYAAEDEKLVNTAKARLNELDKAAELAKAAATQPGVLVEQLAAQMQQMAEAVQMLAQAQLAAQAAQAAQAPAGTKASGG